MQDETVPSLTLNSIKMLYQRSCTFTIYTAVYIVLHHSYTHFLCHILYEVIEHFHREILTGNANIDKSNLKNCTCPCEYIKFYNIPLDDGFKFRYWYEHKKNPIYVYIFLVF